MEDGSHSPASLDGTGPRDAPVGSDRDRLLQAFAEVCSERGYAATTVGDVAARAGVSRASFDRLFPGKEACLLAACNFVLAELVAAAASAYSPDKPLFAFVRDAATAILDLMASRPAFARLAFLEARTATPRAADLYRSGEQVLISLLDQLRSDAPSELHLPASAARGALGGAQAMLRNEIAAGRAEQLPGMLPSILYCCLVAFLGRDEALRQASLAQER